ncbi:MAG: nuclear transport factor 2 family protein [Actinomycetia bacterium]|nr:nuclear transport factor 2 family protein [Actinomycetes bacterium]
MTAWTGTTRTDASTTVTADQLVAMLEALYNHNDASRLRALAAPDLRHYSSGIGDGVDAWAAYAEGFAGANPLVAIHRTVAEGNRIGIHAQYRWNVDRVLDGGPGVAVAHIFTIEAGRIVEAVEVTQAVGTEPVSGNDMFSQLRSSAGTQDPQRNREIARRVVAEFLAGNTSLRDELLSDYIQHNPFIPDGAAGIAGFVDMLGGNPNDYQWAIVEGDLAWTYTRYLSETMGTPPLVGVDIWRFDAAGKVTEHWDVLEADFTSPGGHTFPG